MVDRAGCAPMARLIITLAFCSASLLCAAGVNAGEEDTANIGDFFSDGRHRLDMSYSQVEGFDGDVTLTLPSYTYSFSRSLRATVVTSYVELDFPVSEKFGIAEEIEESGWGDTVIGFQYDPGARLTSGAWVPDTLGFYSSLVMPTGDADKGLSSDTWTAEVGAGWLLDLPYNLLIIPTTAYRKSLKSGSSAYLLNEAALGLGFYWLFPFRAWLGIEPYLAWDFERDTDIDQFRIYAGKSFTNGLAVEVAWGSKDRVDEGSARDDDVLVLSLSWQFGQPPSE
jgi:hypothetical protein